MASTVFFSWQADTPPRVGRNFLKGVLEEVCAAVAVDTNLAEAHRELEVDSDTQGVAGQVPIVDTILKKIDNAAIFVADLNVRHRARRWQEDPESERADRIRLGAQEPLEPAHHLHDEHRVWGTERRCSPVRPATPPVADPVPPARGRNGRGQGRGEEEAGGGTLAGAPGQSRDRPATFRSTTAAISRRSTSGRPSTVSLGRAAPRHPLGPVPAARRHGR